MEIWYQLHQWAKYLVVCVHCVVFWSLLYQCQLLCQISPEFSVKTIARIKWKWRRYFHNEWRLWSISSGCACLTRPKINSCQIIALIKLPQVLTQIVREPSPGSSTLCNWHQLNVEMKQSRCACLMTLRVYGTQHGSSILQCGIYQHHLYRKITQLNNHSQHNITLSQVANYQLPSPQHKHAIVLKVLAKIHLPCKIKCAKSRYLNAKKVLVSIIWTLISIAAINNEIMLIIKLINKINLILLQFAESPPRKVENGQVCK